MYSLDHGMAYFIVALTNKTPFIRTRPFQVLTSKHNGSRIRPKASLHIFMLIDFL